MSFFFVLRKDESKHIIYFVQNISVVMEYINEEFKS